MLTFDEAKHEYRFNGEVVVSVTQVLADCGIIDYSALPLPVREMALERGRMVHTITHWDDEADLDESTVDPIIAPYLAAWRRFRLDTGFVPELIEFRAYSERYGYAGTIDRAGRIGDRRILLDIKTNDGPPWVLYQLAAYAELLEDGRKYERVCVELRKNEKYRLIHAVPLMHMQHWGVFASALNLWRAKQECKRSLGAVAA